MSDPIKISIEINNGIKHKIYLKIKIVEWKYQILTP